MALSTRACGKVAFCALVASSHSRRYPHALSSDSFSWFGAWDPQFKAMNERVNECSRALFAHIIPRLVKFAARCRPVRLTTFRLGISSVKT